MLTNKDVTIIIPHLGKNLEQVRSLGDCVLSLEETCECPIVVATNGVVPQPYHSPALEDHKWVHVAEQGQCKATNAAVATTDTPWILISNDDMIYPLGWFDKLAAPLDSNKEITCISPKLIEPRPGAPTFEVFFCGGAGGDFDKKKFIEFASQYNGSGLRKGFNLPFLIKRDLWDLVGGYDIKYDPWSSNSDSDLEYKIKLAGVQPIQNTDSIVYHFSQTSGTFSPENNSFWQRNFAYFEEKWGFPRTDNGIWEASFDIPNESRKFRPNWEGKYVV